MPVKNKTFFYLHEKERKVGQKKNNNNVTDQNSINQ